MHRPHPNQFCVLSWSNKPVNKWIADLAKLATENEPCILVTVASVRGSAPREVGAKMIVTRRETIGTIGGGQLEYQCARIACEQLAQDNESVTMTRRFALGANCGQCCGGVVDVLFENVSATGSKWVSKLSEAHDQRTIVVMATSTKTPGMKILLSIEECYPVDESLNWPEAVTQTAKSMLAQSCQARLVGDFLLEPIRPTAFNIAIFGAGHVGTATVDVLSRLDCNIRWIDSRRNIFPALPADNVQAVESTEPAREVLAMPAGSMFLVMTHSHPVDLEVCMRVLQREDFAYCGLIGSASKRRRFERLMAKQGISAQQIERLVCPIGVPGVDGRKPMEIAIAVTAEMLQVRDAAMDKQGSDGHNVNKIRAL
jgi:xanthine dehydrogenase accessory factor